jgi:hypothetical protein
MIRIGGEQLLLDTYLPAIPIVSAPDWELASWTALHKPAVIGQETGTAQALRQRLSARQAR